jgi:hypothetical protein
MQVPHPPKDDSQYPHVPLESITSQTQAGEEEDEEDIQLYREDAIIRKKIFGE